MGGVNLPRAELERRFRRRDHENDGVFIVGVLTTGIYCLPSCPAKKPKPENVRFFPDEGEALAAGLRACKRCRPDHFYRRYDPDRELVAELAQRARTHPGEFADAAALTAAAGVGATKLNGLFRRHFHTSPAAYLQRARVSAAKRGLLRTRRRVLDVALEAGFESPSSFHENFRRATGMSPGAYRRLADEREFVIALPEGFRREDLFAIFGRDEEGRTERVDGRRAVKALVLAGRPARLELAFAQRSARVCVHAGRRPSRALMAAAHSACVRMLGLACDPAPFERRVVRIRGGKRLIRGREGLRIPLTANVFEGLVWVIVGQQVNLTFASICRQRLIELCGDPVGSGFLAHPTPEAVAELDYEALQRLQFSRRKAEYLIDLARSVSSGDLEFEGLRALPAGEIEETLGGLRGLGPWSVQYLLMRSLGLEDCVPVGDAALVAALERFFALSGRPDAKETLRLMEVFAPHRSLATFHLWKTLGDSE